MTHPLLGMAIVLGALGGLLGVLTLYRRRCKPHPELLRKLLHVGMGFVTLSFPWLFDATWPVLVLAFLSMTLLGAVRLFAGLKESVGQVVGGVSRFSLGEIYFPVTVASLWALYDRDQGDPPGQRLVLYLVPLLLLTLSDTLAAVVGINYGRRHYATSEGTKTQEGSLAFFLCSLPCIHLPLLLLTDQGWPETLLIAVLIAWLTTMFEAVAWNGLDNLIMPLAARFLLPLYWHLPADVLLLGFAVKAGVFLLVAICSLRTTLSGNAVPGAFLIGYLCWVLGGWQWLLPPLLVFVACTFQAPPVEPKRKKIHTIHSVVCVASAGLLWLFLSRLLGGPEWYYPFTVAFAAHLAIIGLARLRFDHPTIPAWALLSVCVGTGWLLVLTAYGLIHGGTGRAFLEAGLALPAVAAAACGFYLLQPLTDDCPVDTPRWLRQGACGRGVGTGDPAQLLHAVGVAIVLLISWHLARGFHASFDFSCESCHWQR